MSTFILIHGAWHGAWCWYKVVPRLRELGHRVEAPDLPSHGRDRTPISSVSLELYVDRVCQVIGATSEPVILVGHSLGGLVISQVAERMPKKILKLVYLCAFLLEDGQTVNEIVSADTGSLLQESVDFSEDQSVVTVRDEAQRNLFYSDCSEEDVALAKSLLVPLSTALSATPLSVTSQSFGQIPRLYIECTCDKAVTVSMQRAMYERTTCESVISMETSHSPFFSEPKRLADCLDGI